jgi:signal transduction histidine kinase
MCPSETDPIRQIDALNERAWYYRYEDAGKTLEAAREAKAESEAVDYRKGEAYACLNLAYGYFLQSENQEAYELATQALSYFSGKTGEQGWAAALCLLGNLRESFGDYETGLELCHQSLNLARLHGFDEIEGEVLSLMGLIYSRIADYEAAIDHYRRSLDIRTRLGDYRAVASSLNRIARVMALKKDFPAALEHYGQSLKIREEQQHIQAIPWTYLGLASTYEEMGDRDNAVKYYSLNLEKGNDTLDRRCRLQCLLGLGRIYCRSDKYAESKKLLDEAVELAASLNALPLLYEAHQALANLYESQGKPEDALYHYKEFHTLLEQVHNNEIQNRLKNQQIAFAVEKSEHEKEIYQLRNVELKQQKEELQSTLEHLKKTQEQLIQSEKMAALGGLVAGVAHEINTPVGICVTAASGLAEQTKQIAEKYKQNKISKGEFKDYMNLANQSAGLILSNMKKAASLIQSFKQVSVDQSTEQKRKFNLKEYTDDVIRSLYPRLKNSGVNLSVDIDEDLELESYPGVFSQILTNLVINSLVHGFEPNRGGNIKISGRLVDNTLELDYEDDGKGIEEENLTRIFEPFFTTDTRLGTGLGLHITYNLVTRRLNGSISCESQGNQGTVFKIRIPGR